MAVVDPVFPAPVGDTPPPPPSDRRIQAQRQSNSKILVASVLVIAILYFARQVFIPLALAILFAFLLRPIVTVLEKTFLRRTGAIVLSLAISLTILSLGAWSLVSQLNTLAKEFVSYSGNIEKKFRVLAPSAGGTIAMLERTIQKVAESTEKTERPDYKVRVIPERKSLGDRYEEIAVPAEYVASAFLIIVLVFFLLQDREQLRDKMLRLAGRANLTVTTQAIGETLHRISNYLLTQSLLNLGFGLLIGIGLALLQVPHAVLWGVLAALLRFVPYIGAVLSAALPTALALAVFPNWYTPLAVLGLFLVTDQLLAGFIEPLVIGHRVGVSAIALLLSAIFWGWLWGPVGLILATPITVCLNVAGEFIPALRVFSILFGTEAPLEDYLSYYNRLLIRNRAGASAIADRYSEEYSMEATFTDIFLPTLTFANEELGRKRITSVNDHFIKDVTRELIARLGDRNAQVSSDSLPVIAASVAGERLSLGSLMLCQLLRSEEYSIDTFTDLDPGELVAFVAEEDPVAVLVSCSNINHLEQGIELIRQLSTTFKALPIFAGGSTFAGNAEQAMTAGATYVMTSLTDAKTEFLRQGKRRTKKVSPRTA